jgi:hypothetical protein
MIKQMWRAGQRQRVIDCLARNEYPGKGWDRMFPDLAAQRKTEVAMQQQHDSATCTAGTDGGACQMCKQVEGNAAIDNGCACVTRYAQSGLAPDGCIINGNRHYADCDMFSVTAPIVPASHMSIHDLAAIRRAILTCLDDKRWEFYVGVFNKNPKLESSQTNSQRLDFCDAVAKYLLDRA